MEMTLAPRSVFRSTAKILRALAMAWAAAGMLPLPILMTTEPATNGVISCLYLGMASAWLSTEVQLFAGTPQTRRAWLATLLATCVAVGTNVCLFVVFGVAAGVRTNFPFPLMATLSAAPAIGLIPWLVRRVRDRFTALLFAAAVMLAAKLAGCVVARIVYGPDYMAQGYISGDWQSAKLMISLFWTFSTSLSLGLLCADYPGRRAEGIVTG
jgi:hypothetical protein